MVTLFSSLPHRPYILMILLPILFNENNYRMYGIDFHKIFWTGTHMDRYINIFLTVQSDQQFGKNWYTTPSFIALHKRLENHNTNG